MDKESYFISLFDDGHIGDDGAIVEGLIYSSDLFCEDIHFKMEWMSLKQIAYKSMIINISDAVAMNAKPKYALLNIKLPKNFSKEQMRELSSGFLEACKEFDLSIVGGDTVAGDRLDISITIISRSSNPITRDGIDLGDLVGFTGDLGEVGKDLERLFLGKKIKQSSKFIRPKLRVDFIDSASHLIKASMDISDGLSKDLSRLSSINGVGFEFFNSLDRSKLCSGEEYELLFAIDERDLGKIEEIAKECGTKITFFAKAIRGEYKSICKENHFE